MDISKREVSILLTINPLFPAVSIVTDHYCPGSARRRSPPEDRHLHHRVGLALPPPPHLHPAVSAAPAPLQPPRHPQEPGGGALLLRARLPARHQSDRQPGECLSV